VRGALLLAAVAREGVARLSETRIEPKLRIEAHLENLFIVVSLTAIVWEILMEEPGGVKNRARRILLVPFMQINYDLP